MKELTVKDFALLYLHTNAKIKVNMLFETVYKGTVEDLLYSELDILNKIVTIVGANEDHVCIACKK
jgi:hypothetical protein